jgi:hypothetical protein
VVAGIALGTVVASVVLAVRRDDADGRAAPLAADVRVAAAFGPDLAVHGRQQVLVA